MDNNFGAVDVIKGFSVRPGNYLLAGASVVPGGINFTVHSVHAKGCELCLFRRMETEPYAVIPFPDNYRIGDTYSMMIFDLDIHKLEYCYRIIEKDSDGKLVKSPYLIDIYTKAVAGQSVWGAKAVEGCPYHSRVVEDNFEWGNFKQPYLEFKDLIIYEMHVRGFTKHESSGVTHPGTFDAVKEKLPYLKELGINAIELMPIFEFDELEAERDYNGKQLMNYWGYNTVSFFAPNTSYTSRLEYNHEGNEFRELVKACNENGIEVYLDVVFNHTAEGNEDGPTFCFKGYDKNIYYMLTPDGKYVNFSGCGNTMNCNHPVVRRMIIDCLRHWVIEYRVDGFRFDLASILGRAEDGTPLSSPPLLESLAYDPILSKVKLIAEAWDAGGLYQVGSFPSWKRWAEWNGRYRDDLRKFLKSDAGMAEIAVRRILGSGDIYNEYQRGLNASVNFLTCHDGFTLNDLYCYNTKHNEANGWNNTDGTDDNNSWNCGIEGDTDDTAILNLRNRMRKNAFAVLAMSRGAMMFLAGDEFGNSQFGNNNSYCQDNIISWLDWNDLKKNRDLFTFVKKALAFRKKHPVIKGKTAPSSIDFPDISIHNSYPWNSSFDYETRVVGIMYAGKDIKNKNDDIIFMAINMHWENQLQRLPGLDNNMKWEIEYSTDTSNTLDEAGVHLIGRSITVLIAK